jgi:hypothetical protein
MHVPASPLAAPVTSQNGNRGSLHVPSEQCFAGFDFVHATNATNKKARLHHMSQS